MVDDGGDDAKELGREVGSGVVICDEVFALGACSCNTKLAMSVSIPYTDS